MRTDLRRAAGRVVALTYSARALLRSRVRGVTYRSRALPAQVLTWRRGPRVHEAGSGASTAVDRYWGRHLVRSEPFISARESAEYLDWRFAEYPRYRELMELWGDHEGETILDYGCGPGNDAVGFLLYTSARRVIGVDISARALELARRRIALHRIDDARVELVRVSDAVPKLPFDDASVDFVHCSGVLHHTTQPVAILRELRRVLREHGRANVMVYNRRSIWFHLYVAYVLKVAGGDAAPIEDVFRRSTDGPDCPVSVPYEPVDFLEVAADAGFDGSFAGGYLSRLELELLERFAAEAAENARLDVEHRSFIEAVELGDDGLPRVDGMLAGIGGVYHLRPC